VGAEVDAGARIVAEAIELGAAAAGIASVDRLKESPSHQIAPRLMSATLVARGYDARDLAELDWPADARSSLVVAVAHPRERPELDWAPASGNTPGNQMLIEICDALSEWISANLGIGVRRVPYYVDEGGLYLKDAAVLAGLGCVGRNNLLVTPGHGPRVRLRMVLLDTELAPTGPIEFDPCRGCEGPCRSACPRGAFDRVVHSAAEFGIDARPGRDGSFGNARCLVQMRKDWDDSGIETDDAAYMSEVGPAPEAEDGSQDDRRTEWCRACDLACPVGG
jgi:epoxyqueuosine reductase